MWIFNKLNERKFFRNWRKKNKLNQTCAVNFFHQNQVTVGIGTYGGLNVLTYDEKHFLKIGNYCSIAPNVAFILSADHDCRKVSTFPFRVKILGECYEAISKGDIIVDDDVWIGYGATILSGVHIGQGAVIAAGAVVNKDVPPYAIVAGVPAHVIKYRFSDKVIEKMLKVDYSKLDERMVREHIDDLYEDVDEDTEFGWLPQR